MTGPPPAGTVPGRLFSAGPGSAVLSVALPTSLPIPLGATTPGLDLVTWAFAGLAPDDAAGPRALLVLAARDGAGLHGNTTIGLATHYRDYAVSIEAPAPLAELPADDRAVLARALLSAASPATVERLADFTGLFEGAMIVPADDAPEIALPDATCRVSGHAIPDYLLLRRGSAWACLRAARARLAFGPEPVVELTLAPVWGEDAGSAPDAAILLAAHGFTPARLRTA